jgi:tetratricopeptide (TPR) repeat protein
MNDKGEQKIAVSSHRLLARHNSHSISRGLDLARQIQSFELQSAPLDSIWTNASNLYCRIDLQPFSHPEKPDILEELNQTLETNLDSYPQSLANNLADFVFYIERGSLLAGIGNLQDALKDYDRAIKIDPNNIEAYMKRGCLYLQLGEYFKAIADFEQVLQND